ncbi:MAG: NAD(P)/FAD-dependent oxidoreductase [Steroidobacterales bacterium]
MPVAPTPFWSDGVALPVSSRRDLPPAVDALIVGAGYTGLSAARELARAGRSTLVLDAAPLGGGCSGRNGGQVAYSIKPTLAELSSRHGKRIAAGICAEGQQALAHLRSLALDEGLAMDWRERGCFVGAHTRKAFAALVREAETQPSGFVQRVQVVPRSRQHEEIATDFYHGGCVYPDDASIDPLRLLVALHRRAQGSGAVIVDRCEVTAIARSGDGFEAATALGRVRARQVLLATNGYSGALSPWHRRRVIPIGSYQIATEPLGQARLRDLLPQGRNFGDSRRVVVYFRPSPDGERLVFGGRAALAETDPLACVPRLRSMMTQIFPQLRSVSITHAWSGWVAYTFDTLPHLGRHDGVYYSMGYCGQGVPTAPYFGMRIAQQMLGLPAGTTALDGLPFPSRPYYHGRPWFLAASVLAYRALDALGI